MAHRQSRALQGFKPRGGTAYECTGCKRRFDPHASGRIDCVPRCFDSLQSRHRQRGSFPSAVRSSSISLAVLIFPVIFAASQAGIPGFPGGGGGVGGGAGGGVPGNVDIAKWQQKMVAVPFREVYAKLSGANMVGSVGDSKAKGSADFVIFKTGTDVSIRYQVSVSQLSKSEKPTSASIHVATATGNGQSILNLTSSTWIAAGAANKAWGNVAKLVGQGKGKGKEKGGGKTGGSGLVLQGVFRQASKKTITSGESIQLLFATIMQMPGSFYVLVTTPSFPKGAMRGQLKATIFTQLAGCSRGFGC